MRLHSRAPRRSSSKTSMGFTLVELCIVVMLMGLITSALAASFVTAINANRVTTERVKESDDAQVVAAFLVRDAQAAGGSNPATGSVDPTLGVSLTDAAGCTGTGALVIRFEWLDRLAAGTPRVRVASYFYNSGATQITRTTCTDGAAGSAVTLAGSVGAPAPTATCIPAVKCPGMPDLVQLKMTATNTPNNGVTPYTTTLRASLRPEAQITSGTNSSSVPLLSLGTGGPCTAAVGTGLTITGKPTISVNGIASVNMSDAPGNGCTAVFIASNATFTTTGGTTALAGGTCNGGGQCTQLCNGDPLCIAALPALPTSPVIPDPFLGIATPAGTCSGGVNPTPVAGHYPPGVYPQDLVITTSSVLDPGTYVLCNGIHISGTTTTTTAVTGAGVTLYLANGGLNLAATATIALSAPATGTYANLVVWLAATNPTQVLSISSPAVTPSGVAPAGADPNKIYTYTYTGAIYTPAGQVSVSPSSNVVVSILGTVVAQTVNISGLLNGSVTFGVGPPAINAPASLPASTVGRPYSQAIVGTGGLPPYTWSATGLPAGLSLSSTTGVVSGTPSVAGTSSVVVTLTDSQGVTASRTYSPLTINPALSVTTASLPNAALNVPYSTTVASSGGTAALSWTATPLPAGLTMNAATGAISGTPTTNGTTSVTLTVTDAAGATATKVLSLVVGAAPLSVVGLTIGPLPANINGQIAKGDTLTLTYNAAIAVASMCSTWSGNATNQLINGVNQVTVTVSDNAGSTGNDTLTVTSSTCALKFGTIDLGSPLWTTSTHTFVGSGGNASTLAYTASTFTLVVTLGATSGGGIGANVPAQTFVYTPNVALTDVFATPISGSFTFPGSRF